MARSRTRRARLALSTPRLGTLRQRLKRQSPHPGWLAMEYGYSFEENRRGLS